MRIFPLRISLAAFALLTPASALAGPIPVDPGDIGTIQQACVQYADDAVAQYREMMRLQCGLSGPAWHEDRNLHREWCLATGGKFAGNENRNRQAALKSCREAACRTYARSAVDQQQQNVQRNCGFAGSAWDASFNHHYQWCVHGDNQRSADAEQRSRETQLARCSAMAPLDGDFSVVKVVPHVGGSPQGRFIQTVDILLETTSSRPWNIGDYGHPKYGSLWAEVTVNAKIAPNGAVQDNRKTYLFAIRGTAAGTQSFVAPHLGQNIGAGTRTVGLTVAPMPRIPLTGVEKMFSVPGQPFGPGQVGCWYFDPDVSVRVFIAASTHTITERSGKSPPIMNATRIRVYDPPRGGFNQGVVYERCR